MIRRSSCSDARWRLSPDDPAPHRSLASVLWLNLLFRRGAVTVDHYLGSFSRSSVDLAKPPAGHRSRIPHARGRARSRWRSDGSQSNPQDAQAHYDLGAALGLQASYVATVEGKMLAGFRAARRAYDEHEKVLALDPSRNDAGLIVGTYRYLVSTLSLPMRMLAYVAGLRRRARARHPDARAETAAAGIRMRTARHAAMPGPTRCSRSFWCTTGSGGSMKRCGCFRNSARLYPRNRLVAARGRAPPRFGPGARSRPTPC